MRHETSNKGYRRLVVWQKADKLAFKIYLATKDFPKEELFGLVSQMRRSAVSAPANIAEGYARPSSKDKIHFFVIARASLTELEYYIDFALRLKYLTKQQYSELVQLRDAVGRLLNGFIKSTENAR